MKTLRWTSRDLELLADEGKRYEIVDGELYVSRQPHLYHQYGIGEIYESLQAWSRQNKNGRAIFTPGLIFADDDDVVPDVVWISRERLAMAFQADGKLHFAPELAVEVLSPGVANVSRDRETKLKLYSRRGVLEYWVVSWEKHYLEVYRREEDVLKLHSTLYEGNLLQSPYLPGYHCQLSQFFTDVL
jgi:Uma2 family endonuclease